MPGETVLRRRDFLRIGTRLGAGSLLGLGAAYGYANQVEAHHLVLEHRTIHFGVLPAALDGLKVVLMCDHHLHPFTPRELLEHAVEVANAAQPDLVLLAGDYVYTDVEAIHELAPILGRLNARYGVFATLGNHDCLRGPGVIQAALAGQSIEVLVNRGLHVGPPAGRLYLAGLDSVVAGAPDFHRAFAGCDKSDFAVGIVHEPDYFRVLARISPICLQLSGHSHGGQVRIPGFGAVVLPAWGEVYSTGHYELNDRQLYTSRGLGMVCLPVRFDCPPEVTVITLARELPPVISAEPAQASAAQAYNKW